MPLLHLLGTGAAFSDPERMTTMLAFESDTSVIVVDCGGDVVQRLLVAGVPLERIEALIVTHEHADHVSGFPLFMEKIWLSGRRRPIPVYGIRSAIEQARRTWETFDTSGWKGMPEIQWREVPLEEGAKLLEDEQWRVTAAPGDHSVPVIGIRVEDKQGGGIVTYSCDTKPHDPITRLAEGADILVHEATGGFGGHTSPVQAAEVAQKAGVNRLVLVHLPPTTDETEEEMEEARKRFAEVERGEELARYEF